jgi:hypothetical protein
MKNYKFYRALHARGIKLDGLGRELNMQPTHLSMVFNGQRGGQSRERIAKLLLPTELAMLGWNEKGERVPPPPPVKM